MSQIEISIPVNHRGKSYFTEILPESLVELIIWLGFLDGRMEMPEESVYEVAVSLREPIENMSEHFLYLVDILFLFS